MVISSGLKERICVMRGKWFKFQTKFSFFLIRNMFTLDCYAKIKVCLSCQTSISNKLKGTLWPLRTLSPMHWRKKILEMRCACLVFLLICPRLPLELRSNLQKTVPRRLVVDKIWHMPINHSKAFTQVGTFEGN